MARMRDPRARLEAILDDHVGLARQVRSTLLDEVAELAREVSEALEAGGKLVAFGNGGSAADAQHLAAELVGRFQRPRPGLAALALGTNTSTLTAIANDFDYAEVFARQVRALCAPTDIVVGISTSGGAESVVRGVAAASALRARTWGLTGASGGRLADLAARCLKVPSEVTPRIQEMHIMIIHAVSELVDARATGG